MLLNPQQSQLLIIDMQNKLAPAIADFASVEQHCRWLLEVARALHIPLHATEQYPHGLGVTVQSLLCLLQPSEILEKLHFNACAEPAIVAALADQQRPQVVLCGTESHVCVLQTAFGLQANGYQVFVVEEAVGSRQPRDKQLALQRLQQHGMTVLSREMVAFEWLQTAGTPLFKQVSRQFIR